MRSGAEYLASIRGDGRTILLDGDPVEDVTAHPGFAGPIQVIADLYDGAQRDPSLRFDADGGTHSAMWLVPRSAEDLERRRLVHRHWAEGSFGLIGRTPDHVASILTGFAGRRDVFDRGGGRFGDHVTTFHRQARENDWFVSYAVTPPQVDRTRPAHAQPEPFLFPGIVDERDDGIVVRSAQMIATPAAISDYLLISYIAPLQPGDEDHAISVVMPMNAEGLRLYPRRPYATLATSSFDDPLSSRFDESDSFVVLRDVFVPWEHVFVHRDIRLVSAQFHETGAQILANYQALIRFLVKLEFACGLAIELADAHGLSAIPPVQAQLGGDIAAHTTALEALVLAAQTKAELRAGMLIPGPSFVHAGITLQRRWVVGLMRALRELGG